jgi:hypothetical protein
MMTKQRIDVFISSTSIDLPEHRTAVRDAILSLGLFPSGMEHWPVSGENPVDQCHKMVNVSLPPNSRGNGCPLYSTKGSDKNDWNEAKIRCSVRSVADFGRQR